MAEINAYGELFKGKTLTPAIRKAAQRTRDFAEFRIKARTPVRTGKLQQSWQVSLEGNGLRIYNPQHYGVFVEMGTKRMNARPMLAPTVEEAKRVFATELADELSKTLAKKITAQVEKGTFNATGTRDDAIYKALTSGVREVKGGFGAEDQPKGFGKMSRRRMKEWEQRLGAAEPTVKEY